MIIHFSDNVIYLTNSKGLKKLDSHLENGLIFRSGTRNVSALDVEATAKLNGYVAINPVFENGPEDEWAFIPLSYIQNDIIQYVFRNKFSDAENVIIIVPGTVSQAINKDHLTHKKWTSSIYNGISANILNKMVDEHICIKRKRTNNSDIWEYKLACDFNNVIFENLTHAPHLHENWDWFMHQCYGNVVIKGKFFPQYFFTDNTDIIKFKMAFWPLK